MWGALGQVAKEEDVAWPGYWSVLHRGCAMCCCARLQGERSDEGVLLLIMGVWVCVEAAKGDAEGGS